MSERTVFRVKTRDGVVCWRGSTLDEARLVVENRESIGTLRYNCAPHSIHEVREVLVETSPILGGGADCPNGCGRIIAMCKCAPVEAPDAR